MEAPRTRLAFFNWESLQFVLSAAHSSHERTLPNLLVSVLTDATVLKIGSGIKRDLSKLRRDRGLVCHGIVDTQDVAKSLDRSSAQKVALKALAERFLSITVAKSKRVVTSNWENFL